MKRLLRYTALTVMTMAAVACSNAENGSPTSPTSPTNPTNPGVSVRAVIVTAAPTSSTQYQMTAKADLSDGTTRDVTSLSQWSVSAADLASISAGGVLTVLHSGDVEVRATFQSTSGAMHLTLTAPQPPPAGEGMFILSGTVRDVTDNTKALAGVTVTLVAGPDAPKSVVTPDNGHFGFLPLHGGTFSLEATKTGYAPMRMDGIVVDRDREIDIAMTPVSTTTSRR
jgi:hypothetical protein